MINGSVQLLKRTHVKDKRCNGVYFDYKDGYELNLEERTPKNNVFVDSRPRLLTQSTLSQSLCLCDTYRPFSLNNILKLECVNTLFDPYIFRFFSLIAMISFQLIGQDCVYLLSQECTFKPSIRVCRRLVPVVSLCPYLYIPSNNRKVPITETLKRRVA